MDGEVYFGREKPERRRAVADRTSEDHGAGKELQAQAQVHRHKHKHLVLLNMQASKAVVVENQ